MKWVPWNTIVLQENRGKITRCCYDSNFMTETHHDNSKSTHCCGVGALSLQPSHRQGMQLSYEMCSNSTWPFCQWSCTPVSPGHRNDKSYLFLPNHRRKWHSFTRVDLRAAMFSFPSCIAADSSGRLFQDLSKNHAGHQCVQNYAQTSWDVEQTRNRLPFSCQNNG